MEMISKLFFVIAGLTLPALATGGMMNLFSGFNVEREVLIDATHNHRPLALLRAADGGYFVLESGYGNGVVKTDSHGQTQWMYRESGWGIRGHRSDTAVEFTSAAAAPDGGVLLGGHRARPSEHYVDAFAGVLIRLDKDGHVIGRVDPGLQQVLKQTDLFDVYAISRWGDGFGAIAASGITNHKRVVIRLRGDGSIAWQRVFDMRGALFNGSVLARAMANGELVLQGLNSFVRLDADGHNMQEVEMDSSCRWLNYVNPTEGNRFLCNTDNDNPSVIPEFLKVEADEKTVLRLPWPKFKETVGEIGASKIYGTANGNYVLFGATTGRNQRFIPTIMEISSDKSILAKKEFVGLKEDEITDGMPTDLPGEYVVIRPVIHEKAGTAMTFLRRH